MPDIELIFDPLSSVFIVRTRMWTNATQIRAPNTAGNYVIIRGV